MTSLLVASLVKTLEGISPFLWDKQNTVGLITGSRITMITKRYKVALLTGADMDNKILN